MRSENGAIGKPGSSPDVSNSIQFDLDEDGVGNACDTEDDSEGWDMSYLSSKSRSNHTNLFSNLRIEVFR